ncbi:RcnB family protein [Ferrovibrio terrae]|uniref:RcnB family protein n=1 Tax=Ferrovibrio terrae TaxID=2594003 RepID=A0A516GZH9_9PROT|nr:RcnB family protein [Ferrovibrio terrae]QDO96927.1 RcnB family protein [Ferrovibrio terrae]
MRATTSFRIATAAFALAIASTSLTAALPAYADPPGHAKKEKGHAPQGNKGKGGGDSININFSFNDSDRVVIRDYYGHPPGGRCPPGLAKKNNGCMPPGQAKKWMMGHPLPRDVVFYDLPHELRIRMSAPPSGYKYVRVAGDILMIAVGTGMVAAAIEDLARM